MTMFKAPVFTAAGERSGDRDLPETLFDGVVHEAAMWQAVKAYLSNQRQATASAKGRSDVSGGGRKPWRQKGTGRARQGSIRAAQWRGGGNVFGPRPGRNYHQDLPKKVRWLARRSAYNARAQDGGVIVIDAVAVEQPKTKQIVSLLALLGVPANAGMNVLLLTDGNKPHVHLSARNLPGVLVRPFGEESTYDVLWADALVIEAPALERAAEVAHA
ncbi:MAG: 50S ribosomal protein L4 [Longimicrobiales bacterium]